MRISSKMLFLIITICPIAYLFIKHVPAVSSRWEKFELGKYKDVNFFSLSSNFTEIVPNHLPSSASSKCGNFELEKHKDVNFFPYKSNYTEIVPNHLISKMDYNRLINIPFNFTIIHYCNTQAILLLILVHSAPTNVEKRQTIRETWGKEDETTKILFMLGATSEEIQVRINEENHIYNDIVQGSFIDSYRNLSYKHQMGLKYVTYHCRQVKYIIKSDDDNFINTPFVKNFLMKDISPHGARNMIMCYPSWCAKSLRSYGSKWRVTFEEYPYEYYPTYCPGWVILYSPDIVFRLYQETQHTKFLWIDDVLITGIVAKNINFTDHVDISPLTLTAEEVSSLHNASHKYRPFLFGHANMDDAEIRDLWKYVISSPIPVCD